MKTQLVLEDNSIWEGEAFGQETPIAGEVVFATAMTGYSEALTDPSYKGQILVFTYPLIGNYGVGDTSFFQSEKIQVSGVVVSEPCFTPSHWQSQKSLDYWLKENNIPGLWGIDTRALTQKLRDKGTMLGKLGTPQDKIDFYDPNKDNLVAKASLTEPKIFNNKLKNKTVCLVDCGYKKAILDSLLKRDLTVVGIVVSNGPGDPQMADQTIKTITKAMVKKIPILGICLGNQILGLAAGAQTYKLKFGHRSLNQPVKDLLSQHCFITSQNHGFAVLPKSLPKNFKPWFINLNDQTCEGIISDNGLFAGVQFHPEGNPGPTDTDFVFDLFAKKLK